MQMSTTCIAAHPSTDGSVYVLVVTGEDGDYTSTIHLITDFDAADQVLYKVQTWLTGLWLSPAGHLFAASADGRIHDNASGTWQVTDLNFIEGLNWIWGLDEGRIFTCGGSGGIFQYRTGRWARVGENVDGDLYGLRGTSPTDLYVVGESGRIFHGDGSQWRRMASPTNHIINAAYCRSPDEVYLCGTNGILLKGSGSRWVRIGELDFNLHALTMFRDKLYIGAGGRGLYAYDGNAVNLVKDNIISYSLGSSADYLTAAGGDEAARFDGSTWDAVA
jgi:hypothetical protein